MSHAHVVLGVTGSIAAYKAAEIVRLFTKAGVTVECVLTRSAAEFVQPLTFATLTERPVTVDLFGPPAGAAAEYGDRSDADSDAGGMAPGSPPASTAHAAQPRDPAASSAAGGTVLGGSAPPGLATRSAIDHIRASRGADLVVVAPATANILGKVAQGIADDALSTTLLASSVPVMFAPAMNTLMWNHPAVQANVRQLRSWGYLFADPDAGDLACGEFGAGRMAEPAEIVGAALRLLAERSHRPRLLVTAGGTEEDLDPVRALTNRSSGRMGFAVAEAGRNLGLPVTVIAARTSAPVPYGVDVVRVRSAKEMLDRVTELHPSHPLLVMAAAVADYRPKRPAGKKIRSGDGALTLELTPTVDILKTVAAARRGQVSIGFALETERTDAARLQAGETKLARKGVDLLVLNDPTKAGSEFGGATNEVTFLYPDRGPESLARTTKDEVGLEIVRRALSLWNERRKDVGNPGRDPRPKSRAPRSSARPHSAMESAKESAKGSASKAATESAKASAKKSAKSAKESAAKSVKKSAAKSAKKTSGRKR
ncbi:MAG: bifunctional phosphopantothenoylcysteine decarboxylase/phosphopantothenate--cysteine ligase CoaBC [Candidatus Eisenbacteria bacterium]